METAEEQAGEIGVNDIDDETPAASDNDDDDVMVKMWITVNPEYLCPQRSKRGVCFCANSVNQKSFLGT